VFDERVSDRLVERQRLEALAVERRVVEGTCGPLDERAQFVVAELLGLDRVGETQLDLGGAAGEAGEVAAEAVQPHARKRLAVCGRRLDVVAEHGFIVRGERDFIVPQRSIAVLGERDVARALSGDGGEQQDANASAKGTMVSGVKNGGMGRVLGVHDNGSSAVRGRTT
jgi:hypothetical protein